MKRFRVSAEVTISLSTVVMAKDEKEAIELASARGMTSIVNHSQDEDSEWITSGEIDGDPMNLVAEEDED